MAKAKKTSTLTPEERFQQALVPDWEQPYKVPENWVWTQLEKLTSIKTGKEDANFACDDGKYLFFTCAEEPLQCNIPAFEGEAILVAGNGAFHVNYYAGNFNAYQRTYVISDFRASIGKYVYYHTLRAIQRITSGNRGSTIRYIRLGDLADSAFALPPLAEQHRIVSRIESLFEKLDQARELIQTALDSFETRKAAILHKAFTGELTAKWRTKNGVGMESWCKEKFGCIAHIKSNLVDPAKFPEFPHIAPDNIEKRTGILLKYRNIQDDGVKSNKHRFYAGQILYSKIRPYLSKVIIVDFDGLCSADMYPIDATGDNRYLWYQMLSDEFLEQASNAGSRSVLPKINQKELTNLTVNIPTLPEQQEIVRILDSLLEKEQQAKSALEPLPNQIDLMKKSILARAFRGKLGTNDPTEPTAHELLKEILARE